jgi:hypothetical protein
LLKPDANTVAIGVGVPRMTVGAAAAALTGKAMAKAAMELATSHARRFE